MRTRRDRYGAVLRDRAPTLEGPWVAERALAAGSLLTDTPDAIHPVTRQILQGGTRPSAMDAFTAFYKLEELRSVAVDILQDDRRASAADRADRLYGRTDLADPIHSTAASAPIRIS